MNKAHVTQLNKAVNWDKLFIEEQRHRLKAECRVIRAVKFAENGGARGSEDAQEFIASLSEAERAALICDLADRCVEKERDAEQAVDRLNEELFAMHLLLLIGGAAAVILQVLL